MVQPLQEILIYVLEPTQAPVLVRVFEELASSVDLRVFRAYAPPKPFALAVNLLLTVSSIESKLALLDRQRDILNYHRDDLRYWHGEELTAKRNILNSKWTEN